MAESYEIRETGPGAWECLDDGQVLDRHRTLDDALEHLRSLADARGRTLDVVVLYGVRT